MSHKYVMLYHQIVTHKLQYLLGLPVITQSLLTIFCFLYKTVYYSVFKTFKCTATNMKYCT